MRVQSALVESIDKTPNESVLKSALEGGGPRDAIITRGISVAKVLHGATPYQMSFLTADDVQGFSYRRREFSLYLTDHSTGWNTFGGMTCDQTCSVNHLTGVPTFNFFTWDGRTRGDFFPTSGTLYFYPYPGEITSRSETHVEERAYDPAGAQVSQADYRLLNQLSILDMYELVKGAAAGYEGLMNSKTLESNPNGWTGSVTFNEARLTYGSGVVYSNPPYDFSPYNGSALFQQTNVGSLYPAGSWVLRVDGLGGRWISANEVDIIFPPSNPAPNYDVSVIERKLIGPSFLGSTSRVVASLILPKNVWYHIPIPPHEADPIVAVLYEVEWAPRYD